MCIRDRSCWITETFSVPNFFNNSFTIVDFPEPVPPATPTTIDFGLDLTNAITQQQRCLNVYYFAKIFFLLTERSGKQIGRTSEKFLTK